MLAALVGAWLLAAGSAFAQAPDLTVSKTHNGNFTRSQVGAAYQIIVFNAAGSGPVVAGNTVTVVDTLPAGLTATAMSGSGWNCVLATLTCTRSDGLSANSNYPAIALTVNVAANAASPLINSVAVSGGGQTNTANDTATDSTTILLPADLTVSKTHNGNFTRSQVGAAYQIIVFNAPGVGPVFAGNTVTVVDTLPAGLTATAMSGSGWTCVLGTLTCTRSDGLSANSNYPAIALTVNVAANAASPLINSVTVSGGGKTNTANDTATDSTTILLPADLTVTKTHNGNFTEVRSGAAYQIIVFNAPGSGRCLPANGDGGRHAAGRADRDGDERDGLDLRAGHADLHAQRRAVGEQQLSGDRADGERGRQCGKSVDQLRGRIRRWPDQYRQRHSHGLDNDTAGGRPDRLQDA